MQFSEEERNEIKRVESEKYVIYFLVCLKSEEKP